MSSSSTIDPSGRLLEEYVQDAFHSYLKSSLAQAKAERLLDVDMLSSAEGDLMITGPALCLYFAALRCTTSPPSVPLPRRRDKHAGGQSGPQMDLSLENCPPAFISFLEIWSQAVPDIQALIPEHQHDLARIICGLPPVSVPPTSPTYSSSSPNASISQNLNRIAADLRAVAIEISQRRSFQERYSGDLQAAIDTDGGGGGKVRAKASFVPPPVYTPSPTSSFSGSLPPSPAPSVHTQFPSHEPPQSPTYGNHLEPPAPSFPVPSIPQGPPQAGSSSAPHQPQQQPHHEGTHHRSRTPSILNASSPAIELIRETLYAALGDVLESTPSLRGLLKTDPPRAYYASVALSILRMSTTNVTEEGTLIGVLSQEMKIGDAPVGLHPFLREFADIGRTAHVIEEEDTEEVVRLLEAGKTEIPEPRIERVREILECGVGRYNSRPPRGAAEGEGGSGGSGRRSTEGRAVAFANRINALALGMTKLRQFRERQGDVFKVLAGVGAT